MTNIQDDASASDPTPLKRAKLDPESDDGSFPSILYTDKISPNGDAGTQPVTSQSGLRQTDLVAANGDCLDSENAALDPEVDIDSFPNMESTHQMPIAELTDPTCVGNAEQFHDSKAVEGQLLAGEQIDPLGHHVVTAKSERTSCSIEMVEPLIDMREEHADMSMTGPQVTSVMSHIYPYSSDHSNMATMASTPQMATFQTSPTVNSSLMGHHNTDYYGQLRNPTTSSYISNIITLSPISSLQSQHLSRNRSDMLMNDSSNVLGAAASLLQSMPHSGILPPIGRVTSNLIPPMHYTNMAESSQANNAPYSTGYMSGASYQTGGPQIVPNVASVNSMMQMNTNPSISLTNHYQQYGVMGMSAHMAYPSAYQQQVYHQPMIQPLHQQQLSAYAQQVGHIQHQNTMQHSFNTGIADINSHTLVDRQNCSSGPIEVPRSMGHIERACQREEDVNIHMEYEEPPSTNSIIQPEFDTTSFVKQAMEIKAMHSAEARAHTAMSATVQKLKQENEALRALIGKETGTDPNDIVIEEDTAPHERDFCTVFPFQFVKYHSIAHTMNSKTCSKCRCFLCEKNANECFLWTAKFGSHANATSRNLYWRQKKSVYVMKGRPTSVEHDVYRSELLNQLEESQITNAMREAEITFLTAEQSLVNVYRLYSSQPSSGRRRPSKQGKRRCTCAHIANVNQSTNSFEGGGATTSQRKRYSSNQHGDGGEGYNGDRSHVDDSEHQSGSYEICWKCKEDEEAKDGCGKRRSYSDVTSKFEAIINKAEHLLESESEGGSAAFVLATETLKMFQCHEASCFDDGKYASSRRSVMTRLEKLMVRIYIQEELQTDWLVPAMDRAVKEFISSCQDSKFILYESLVSWNHPILQSWLRGGQDLPENYKDLLEEHFFIVKERKRKLADQQKNNYCKLVNIKPNFTGIQFYLKQDRCADAVTAFFQLSEKCIYSLEDDRMAKIFASSATTSTTKQKALLKILLRYVSIHIAPSIGPPVLNDNSAASETDGPGSSQAKTDAAKATPPNLNPMSNPTRERSTLEKFQQALANRADQAASGEQATDSRIRTQTDEPVWPSNDVQGFKPGECLSSAESNAFLLKLILSPLFLSLLDMLNACLNQVQIAMPDEKTFHLIDVLIYKARISTNGDMTFPDNVSVLTLFVTFILRIVLYSPDTENIGIPKVMARFMDSTFQEVVIYIFTHMTCLTKSTMEAVGRWLVQYYIPRFGVINLSQSSIQRFVLSAISSDMDRLNTVVDVLMAMQAHSFNEQADMKSRLLAEGILQQHGLRLMESLLGCPERNSHADRLSEILLHVAGPETTQTNPIKYQLALAVSRYKLCRTGDERWLKRILDLMPETNKDQVNNEMIECVASKITSVKSLTTMLPFLVRRGGIKKISDLVKKCAYIEDPMETKLLHQDFLNDLTKLLTTKGVSINSKRQVVEALKEHIFNHVSDYFRYGIEKDEKMESQRTLLKVITDLSPHFAMDMSNEIWNDVEMYMENVLVFPALANAFIEWLKIAKFIHEKVGKSYEFGEKIKKINKGKLGKKINVRKALSESITELLSNIPNSPTQNAPTPTATHTSDAPYTPAGGASTPQPNTIMVQLANGQTVNMIGPYFMNNGQQPIFLMPQHQQHVQVHPGASAATVLGPATSSSTPGLAGGLHYANASDTESTLPSISSVAAGQGISLGSVNGSATTPGQRLTNFQLPPGGLIGQPQSASFTIPPAAMAAYFNQARGMTSSANPGDDTNASSSYMSQMFSSYTPGGSPWRQQSSDQYQPQIYSASTSAGPISVTDLTPGAAQDDQMAKDPSMTSTADPQDHQEHQDETAEPASSETAQSEPSAIPSTENNESSS